ncbi:LytR C-terminal domain-containing protein [Patescibacteria group bacterium]
MQEGQNQENQEVVQNEAPAKEEKSPNVSFPTVGQKKKGNAARTLVVLGILVLVAALGFVIFKGASNKTEETPSPAGDTLSTPTVSEPSPTAEPVDKTEVSVQVLNGTGIAGEAGLLQTKLEKLGYADIKVGNAESQDQTTTKVTFSSTLSSEVVDEITTSLKETYKEVSTVTSSTGTYDVVITTGLRVGTTPIPSASPTPASTPTASPTATPTASPTATPATP